MTNPQERSEPTHADQPYPEQQYHGQSYPPPPPGYHPPQGADAGAPTPYPGAPQQYPGQQPFEAQQPYPGQPQFPSPPQYGSQPYPGQAQYPTQAPYPEPQQQTFPPPQAPQPYPGQPFSAPTGQFQYSGQTQYPGQAQPPGQSQYSGQAQFPGQTQFPDQAQYPAQAQYPGHGGQPYPAMQQFPGGYGYPGAPSGTGSGDPTDVLGRRCWQHILDTLVLTALVLVGAGVVVGAAIAGLDPTAVFIFGGLMYIAFAVASWASQAWWPMKHNGQTPAMQWTKLRIITEDGGAPTMGALTIRWLLLIIDGGIVGLILIASTSRHQRLGDMAAKTLVIRTD